MYNESLVKRFVKLGVAWSERSCSKNILLNLNITIKLYINYCEVYKSKKYSIDVNHNVLSHRQLF